MILLVGLKVLIRQNEIENDRLAITGLQGRQDISGEIIADPIKRRNKYRVQLGKVVISGRKVKGRLSLICQKLDGAKRGDRISLTAKIRVQRQAANSLATTTARIQRIDKPDPPNYFLGLREYCKRELQRLLPQREAGLAIGYLLGEKAAIDQQLIKDFNLSGISHVIVASGFALAIMINIASNSIGRFSRFAKSSSSIMMMIVFVGMTGFTPSITRAFIMSVSLIIFSILGRKVRPLRLLLLVMSLDLLIRPENCFELGWQLSYVAYFGIACLAPLLTWYFYGCEKPNKLARSIIMCISAQIACLPLTSYSFGYFSLASLASNLLIPPLVAPTMLLSALTICFKNSLFQNITVNACHFLLRLQIRIVEWLADEKWLVIEYQAKQAQWWLLAVLVVTVYIILNYKRTNEREKMAEEWIRDFSETVA